MTPLHTQEAGRRNEEDLSALDATRAARAEYLQMRGYTFTEIAEQMGVDRESVVAELYWKRLR